MKVSALKVPLAAILGGSRLFLNDIAPYFEYKENKRTANQLGTAYTCVSTANYDKFVVKVPSGTAAPAITLEQLKASKAQVFAEFPSATVSFYQDRIGELNLKIEAAEIVLPPSRQPS